MQGTANIDKQFETVAIFSDTFGSAGHRKGIHSLKVVRTIARLGDEGSGIELLIEPGVAQANIGKDLLTLIEPVTNAEFNIELVLAIVKIPSGIVGGIESGNRGMEARGEDDR